MPRKRSADVKLVAFACEAGMGSSLIGANQLKKKIKDLGREIRVIHSPVNAIPADTDVIIAHQALAERARRVAPDAVVLTFQNFMNNTATEHLVQSLKSGEDLVAEPQ